MYNIKGKNVLITGASRGIGAYIAEEFALNGANVSLVARPQSIGELTRISKKLSGYGIKAIPTPGDICNTDHRTEIIRKTKEELGSIDIFISNAAMESVASFINQSETIIEESIELNLIAPLLLAKKILPDMLKRGSGSIVAISSLAGKLGSPYQASYSATKAGLIKWVTAMQRELKDSGVKFSVVCPGYVSGAGMYADMVKEDPKHLKTPRVIGDVTPKQVAEGVVKAVLKGKPDVIVAPGAIRLLSALNELSSGMVTGLMNFSGIIKYNKELSKNA